MLCDVVLVRKEGADAAKLEDALPAVKDGKLIDRREVLPQFLIIEAVGNLAPAAFAGVVGVYRLLSQRFRQLLQGRALLAAEEDGAVAVADDCVGVVLIQGFELALRLQDEAGRDFTAADGGDQLFKLGDLPDVRKLVQQAPDMDRQTPAVHVVRLVAQKIEKLGIHQRGEKIERVVRIGNDDKQGGPLVAQRVQLQLVVGRQLPKLLNVERGHSCAAGNQDGFCRFARDKLSRTFSSKYKSPATAKSFPLQSFIFEYSYLLA